jgi:hypothetical protein
MTSANVINYSIFENGIEVGSHRQNIMCKTCNDGLLKFQPPHKFTILSWGYDENENDWYGDEIPLDEFLSKNKAEITFIEFKSGDKIKINKRREIVEVISVQKVKWSNEYKVKNQIGEIFYIHQNEIISKDS